MIPCSKIGSQQIVVNQGEINQSPHLSLQPELLS